MVEARGARPARLEMAVQGVALAEAGTGFRARPAFPISGLGFQGWGVPVSAMALTGRRDDTVCPATWRRGLGSGAALGFRQSVEGSCEIFRL